MMDSIKVKGLFSAGDFIEYITKHKIKVTRYTDYNFMQSFLCGLTPTGGRKLVDKLIEAGKITLEENYEVETILDHVIEKGVHYYLIKWQGWSNDYNTWEPREHLTDCDDIVIQFHEDRTAAQSLSASRRSRTTCHVEPESKKRRADELLEHILTYNNSLTSEDLYEAWKASVGPLANARLIGKGRNFRPRTVRACSGATAVKKGTKLYKKRREETMRALKNWEKKLNDINTDPAGITVENNVDLEGPPHNFIYTNDYIAGTGVELLTDPVIGCECENCITDKKSCCSASAGGWPFAYYSNKRLRLEKGYPVYECNKKCKCGPDCPNRVVQSGRKHRVCIFRTSNSRGWGVRTLQLIKKGSFVMEYVGEVITHEEAERRGKEYDADGMTYLFDLDFQDRDTDCPYTVDAGVYGNVSHFVNHSCDPNLVVHVVWINNLDPRLPRIALYAARDIKKGEELTFDYQMTGDMTEEDAQNLVVPNPPKTPQKEEIEVAVRDLAESLSKPENMECDNLTSFPTLNKDTENIVVPPQEQEQVVSPQDQEQVQEASVSFPLQESVVSSESATSFKSPSSDQNSCYFSANDQTTDENSPMLPAGKILDESSVALTPDRSTTASESQLSDFATPRSPLKSVENLENKILGSASDVSPSLSVLVSPSKRIKAKHEGETKKKNRILCLCGTAKCRKYLI